MTEICPYDKDNFTGIHPSGKDNPAGLSPWVRASGKATFRFHIRNSAARLV